MSSVLRVLRMVSGPEYVRLAAALCVIAFSAIYMKMSLNDAAVLLKSAECFLLLACFGWAILRVAAFPCFIGIGCAALALIVSSLFNNGLLLGFAGLPVSARTGLNIMTVCAGALLSALLFYRLIGTMRFAGWALVSHFLLLAALQRDQLGLDFLPYELGNPVQWAPTCLLACALGLGFLFGRTPLRTGSI
jgi:hypothetical protein